MSGLDMIALENRAKALGVTVESLLDPTFNDAGDRITTKTTTDANYTTGSDFFDPISDYLNEQSGGLFAQQSDEYRQAVENGMPDPDNIGYTVDGRRITDPSLWMADTAIQELGGLGIDIASLMLPGGPLVGVALAVQQNVAEAGQAGSNDVETRVLHGRICGWCC